VDITWYLCAIRGGHDSGGAGCRKEETEEPEEVSFVPFVFPADPSEKFLIAKNCC